MQDQTGQFPYTPGLFFGSVPITANQPAIFQKNKSGSGACPPGRRSKLKSGGKPLFLTCSTIGVLEPIKALKSGRFYLDCAEFFDKRDAVDFVQGRNTGENLLQGRLSQALQPLGLGCAPDFGTRPPLDDHLADIIRQIQQFVNPCDRDSRCGYKRRNRHSCKTACREIPPA